MAAPLHADLELARRVETAEIEFCALAGARSTQWARLDVAGATALCGARGSPLNKVLGLGLHGPVGERELARLEEFYAQRGEPAQVELCPLAEGGLTDRLARRGFVLQGFENELARELDGDRCSGIQPHPDLSVGAAADDDEWVRLVAAGFAGGEPPVGGGTSEPAPEIDVLVDWMRAFVHPRIVRLLARSDGVPAGAGACWEHAGVLGVFGTATLPAFRRRGVQAALAQALLERASADATLAVATTAPGSTSQRTFERLGFRVLYTRAILVRPAAPPSAGAGAAPGAA